MIDVPRPPIAFLAAFAAVVLGAAPCGGSDDRQPSRTAAATATAVPTPAPPEGAGKAFGGVAFGAFAASALDRKRGELIASSAFDTARNGFAFRNYGSNRGPMMRAEEVWEIFGDDVCVVGSASGCVLTPIAERWRLQLNAGLAIGHCYGFSTLSLQMFRGVVDPSEYGAASTHDLRIADANGAVTNPELAADLTRAAAMQTLPRVQARSRILSPRATIKVLIDAFRSGDDAYVLGFAMKGEGGHAVVPVAVLDQGSGVYEIQLYDNNFPYFAPLPGVSDRRMTIDTRANTWEYRISIRPGVPQDRWHGRGSDNPLLLVRSEDQTLPHPCVICPGAPAGTPITVTLSGHAERHGRLRITDREGRVTGYDGSGRVVNEIPGARIVPQQVIQRQFVEPEPFYEMPTGRGYVIRLVDVPPDAPPQAIHATGPDVGVGLAKLTDAGTTLRLGEGGGVALANAEQTAGAPLLSVAVEGDREVRIVPQAERLRLSPGRGGNLRIAGAVDTATAFDPELGARADIEGKTVDLDELVGAGG